MAYLWISVEKIKVRWEENKTREKRIVPQWKSQDNLLEVVWKGKYQKLMVVGIFQGPFSQWNGQLVQHKYKNKWCDVNLNKQENNQMH